MDQDARRPHSGVDYRQNPNAGGVGSVDAHADRYGQSQEGMHADPPTDQTWKSLDAMEDHARFNGMNSPQQQAELLANPSPDNSQGWSPDGWTR